MRGENAPKCVAIVASEKRMILREEHTSFFTVYVQFPGVAPACSMTRYHD